MFVQRTNNGNLTKRNSVCNFLLFCTLVSPEIDEHSDDVSALDGTYNDKPVFVERGMGSVILELTPASASTGVHELNLDILNLGTPLIPKVESDTTSTTPVGLNLTG